LGVFGAPARVCAAIGSANRSSIATIFCFKFIWLSNKYLLVPLRADYVIL